MRRHLLLSILAWCLFLPSKANAKLTETKRLVALARVWGFLKYHHPSISNSHLDWDSVLIAALPRIEATRTKQDLNDQLQELITILGPIPADTSSIPLGLIDRDANFTWLHDNQILTPRLQSSLLRIWHCHTFPSPHPNISSTISGVITHQERAYASTELPSQEVRLLGLIRYWNIIEYYYPYKYTIGEKWAEVLFRFIPRFRSSDSSLSYHLLILELVAQIHDTHGFVFNSAVLSSHYGDYYPPLEVSSIEGQIVITKIYNSILPKSYSDLVGARILRSGGIPVNQIIDKNSKYVAASTAAAKQRDVLRFVLRGQKNDSLTLMIQTKSGRKVLRFPRNLTISSLDNSTYKDYYYGRNIEDTTIVLRSLPNNLAYIHLGGLKLSQVESTMRRFHNKRGIILDLRNYPQNGVVEKISTYLNSDKLPYATFIHPALNYPSYLKEGPTYHIPLATKNTSDIYSGKIVVLVNEKTQSYGELSAMLLQAIPGVSVIGSQTAGADGNIIQVPFPGGVETYYSGIGVYYPDKRETQRVGILPNYSITPTLIGIQSSRDEVLEKALQYMLTE